MVLAGIGNTEAIILIVVVTALAWPVVRKTMNRWRNRENP
jgi:hypothetical protein